MRWNLQCQSLVRGTGVKRGLPAQFSRISRYKNQSCYHIPEKYKIAHIPNLLDAYYKKFSEERDKKRETEMKMKILNEFFSEKIFKSL